MRTTDGLYNILTEQISYDAAVLNTSMADYAFFPLLPILQNKRVYPARLVENAAKCLRVLIQYGWKTNIDKDNAQRLLILLTSVVTGGQLPGAGGSDTSAEQPAGIALPEETVVEGYRALAALMKAAGAASSGPGTAESPLVAAHVVPVLAHTITVMLDGVTDSIIPAVQLEALNGIGALYTTVKDLEALASFLPGTVSALVRVVAQPGAHKTPKRVVVRALAVLFAVLTNTLGDLQTRRLQRKAALPGKDEPKSGDDDVEAEVISSSVVAARSRDPAAAEPSSAATAVKKQILDAAWLKATASQVKIALASVLKLRNHESEDVRDFVQAFCVGLLDECHGSLSDCASILVESAIVTAPGDDAPTDGADAGQTATLESRESAGFGALKDTADTATAAAFRTFGLQTTLQDLAILYPELADIIKSTAYNWATSLPRAMQANEEEAKQRALRNLQKAIAVLEALNIDSAMLRASLTAALRDSLTALVVTSGPSASATAAIHEAVSEDTLLLQPDKNNDGSDAVVLRQKSEQLQLQQAEMMSFKPVLLPLGVQNGTRAAVLDLIAHVGSPSQQATLAADMLDYARDSDGLDQVSGLWLSFELVKASFSNPATDLDSLIDFSSLGEGIGSASEAVFEDLLTFSVSALASHSDANLNQDDRDWRIDAIALEVTAYAAGRLKEDFRPELIDVLYPIATYLGSSEDRLRMHAITALNSVAVSCGYGSVSELIIDNVDYMLNSVSLRLNTFDISPASTKVLTMMIRLAGPRLVPYLDDVIAAIFAALDNYHGYPLFVESLFTVLGEVVQQSVKSPMLLLEDGTSAASAAGPTRNLKRLPESSTTDDLLDILDRRAKRRKELDEADGLGTDRTPRGHPKQPWKEVSEADKLLRKLEKQAKKGSLEDEEGEEQDGQDEDDDDDDEADRDRPPEESNEVAKPEEPKTPTYALLTRITTLTQHYLTAPTPTLRKSLLGLLVTVAPALSPDENAFLPLVNAIWPVVVARLYDGEPYVVTAACEALSALCASTGDFLATRIKAEWHANLAKWCVRCKAAAASKVRGAAAASKPSIATNSNLRIGNRPSVIHIHTRQTAMRTLTGTRATTAVATAGTDIVLPTRPGSTPSEQQQAVVVAGGSSGIDGGGGGGLGRFAQAVQIWEAVAGLLTAIVRYVKLDYDIYDAILDLVLLPASPVSSVAAGGPVRVLPALEEQKAREALAVVNADAVWLVRYRARQLRLGEDGLLDDDEAWMVAQPPVLAGAQFVSLA